MSMRSIQRQLITTVLLLELLSALAVTSIAYIHERHTVFHALDIMLRGQADSLLGAVQDAEDLDDNVMLNQADVHAPHRDQYLILDEKGRTLGSTALSGQFRLPPNMPTGSVVPMELDHHRYRAIVVHGSRWIDAAEPSGGLIRHVTVVYATPVNRAWSIIHQTVLFYALSSLLVMACTALWLLWSLRRTLAPLEGLARAATKLTAGSWKFEAPAQARATTELQPLVLALEQSIAGIEDAFRRQQRFVGDAAHELKTAVAVVKSSLQLVTIRQRTEAEYRTGIERCQQDILRLESLVQQMLLLARAEDTPDAAPAEVLPTCDLREMADAVVQQLTPVAAMQQVQILVDGPHLPAQIEPAQARTLLENLIANAIQFSPPQEAVLVSISGDAHHAMLAVRDHGPGVSAQEAAHIFERFWRGDPSRSRDTGGSGLGLSIVKAIVERWHGSIHVDHVQPHGAIFHVRLPLAGQTMQSASSASVKLQMTQSSGGVIIHES